MLNNTCQLNNKNSYFLKLGANNNFGRQRRNSLKGGEKNNETKEKLEGRKSNI